MSAAAWRGVIASMAILVLSFLLAPMAAIIPLSLSPTELMRFPPEGISFRWYAELFGSGRWMLAARNSLIVAFAPTVLATVLGTLAAFGLTLGRFRGKAALVALLSLPIITTSNVTAASLFLGFSLAWRAGPLAGLVLAHTVVAVPFVVISVLAALKGFDMTLLRAAAASGAAPHVAFLRIVVPLVRPGILAGAVFAFATSFDEFIITLFIAGPAQYTLPRQIYASVREFLSPAICAAAVLLFVCSTVLLGLSSLARKAQ